MDALTLAELKRICGLRGLAVGGNKSDLIERLTVSSKVRATGSKNQQNASENIQETEDSSLFPVDYDALTLPQLKDLCRKRTLPVGGIKDDIVGRLKASDPRNMTLIQLKDRCREAGLPVTGTKADLADRVMKTLDSAGGTVDDKAKKTTSNDASATKQNAPRKVTASTVHPPKAKAETTKPAKPTQKAVHVQPNAAASQSLKSKLDVEAAAGKKRKVVDAEASKPGKAKAPKTSAKTTASSRPIQHQQPKIDAAKTHKLTAKAHARPDSLTSSSSSHGRGCYLVYTVEKSEASDSVAVYSTKAAANARVRREFYEMHPEGWSEEDFARHADAVRADYKDELLKLSLQAPHKPWGVTAMWLPTNDAEVTKMDECYLVYSLRSMMDNEKSRRVNFIHLFTTKEAANALMKKVFYEQCPWNWTAVEFNDGGKPWASDSEGMKSLCKVGSKMELWQAQVVPVKGGDAPPPPTWFVVHTTRAFRQARNGPCREPIYDFYPPVKSREEANAWAEKVFYQENPWAWEKSTFARKNVQMTYHRGRLLEISVRDNDSWSVRVVAVPEVSCILEANPRSGIVVYGLRGRENRVQRESQDPDMDIERILVPTDPIGARVEEVFYKNNPFGWKRAEFPEESMYYEWSRPKIEKGVENGFPKWSIAPSGNQSWSVRCKAFNLQPLKPGDQ